MTESKIVKACLDLLESLNRKGLPVLAARTNAGGKNGCIKTVYGTFIKLMPPGWGDITACIDGRAVMIETKTLDGEQRDKQEEMQTLWESAGGIYLLVNKLSVLRDFLRNRGML